MHACRPGVWPCRRGGSFVAVSSVRVLYSFPHRIGSRPHLLHGVGPGPGARRCRCRGHRDAGVGRGAAAEGVRVAPTLARGQLRVPYRAARRAPRARRCTTGSWRAASASWPARSTSSTPGRSVRSRRSRSPASSASPPCSSARTPTPGSPMRSWRDECARLGVALPPDHEHAYNEAVLAREEAEYALTDRLLCPSEFVVQTFVDQGVARDRLVRHIYGYDEKRFFPAAAPRSRDDGLTMLYVGVAAVRKGLHYALDAWLRSPASQQGTFLVAGEVLPAYGERLKEQLAHPSVQVLGHRDDVADLMRSQRRPHPPEHRGGLRPGLHGGDGVGLRSARVRRLHGRMPASRERPRASRGRRRRHRASHHRSAR